MDIIDLEMILRNILLQYAKHKHEKNFYLKDQLHNLKVELKMQVWLDQPFTCFLYQIYRDNCKKRIPAYESKVGWHTYTMLVIFLRLHLQGDNPSLEQHLKMRKILTLNSKIIAQIRVCLWLGQEFCTKLAGDYDQNLFNQMNRFIENDFHKKKYVHKYKLPDTLERYVDLNLDYVSPILLCP